MKKDNTKPNQNSNKEIGDYILGIFIYNNKAKLQGKELSAKLNQDNIRSLSKMLPLKYSKNLKLMMWPIQNEYYDKYIYSN